MLQPRGTKTVRSRKQGGGQRRTSGAVSDVGWGLHRCARTSSERRAPRETLRLEEIEEGSAGEKVDAHLACLAAGLQSGGCTPATARPAPSAEQVLERSA